MNSFFDSLEFETKIHAGDLLSKEIPNPNPSRKEKAYFGAGMPAA
jgi:hypothetical protein